MPTNNRRRKAFPLFLGLGLALVVPSTAFAAGPPPPPPPPGDATPPPAPPTDAGAPPAPPPAPAPTPTAGGSNAQGEALYKAEDYQSSAMQFYKVAAGEIPGDQPRAQFWLGKALYKMEFYSAALSVFDEIVQAGPSHPFHKLTLPWLASLSRELPEGAEVLQKIGTYKPTDLEDEDFDEVRDELYYLLGRFYYQKGDLAQGVALLDQVPKNSDYYIPAQFFLGVAHTRDFKGEPAVGAFKNVLRRAIELREAAEANKKKKRKADRKAKKKAKVGTSRSRRREKQMTSAELTFEEEMLQYEHLAALGLANIFYMVGQFDTATKFLDKVPLQSKYFLDAVHWAAWAEFRKVEIDDENANRHYQRTLGYVHTLNAPFFDDYLYPDALKLKAVTYYFNCRYDSAKRTVDEFNRRYPATMEQLSSILDQAPEDYQLYELARKIILEESGLDPFVEQVAQKALYDKTLSKYFAYVEELERETQVFEDMSGDFTSSGVGERVSEDLDLAMSAARERTGAEARSRITAQIKEIKDLNKEMIKVEYEILEKRKQQKELESVPPKPQKPEIDREHEIYKYNGEYWQDELGYYRYEVTSLCKE
jgi:tetratricopeptide (TPR) repeat protein